MLSETFLNINISFRSCECFPVIDSIYFDQFIADPILFSSKTPRPRGVKCDMRNRNRKFFLREAILEGFLEMNSTYSGGSCGFAVPLWVLVRPNLFFRCVQKE